MLYTLQPFPSAGAVFGFLGTASAATVAPFAAWWAAVCQLIASLIYGAYPCHAVVVLCRKVPAGVPLGPSVFSKYWRLARIRETGQLLRYRFEDGLAVGTTARLHEVHALLRPTETAPTWPVAAVNVTSSEGTCTFARPRLTCALAAPRFWPAIVVAAFIPVDGSAFLAVNIYKHGLCFCTFPTFAFSGAFTFCKSLALVIGGSPLAFKPAGATLTALRAWLCTTVVFAPVVAQPWSAFAPCGCCCQSSVGRRRRRPRLWGRTSAVRPSRTETQPRYARGDSHAWACRALVLVPLLWAAACPKFGYCPSALLASQLAARALLHVVLSNLCVLVTLSSF